MGLSASDIARIKALAAGPAAPRIQRRPWLEALAVALRPFPLPPELTPAFRRFADLFVDLLIRDSRTPKRDAERMTGELQDPAFRKTALAYVVEWEFGRVVAVVAAAGPAPIVGDLVHAVWPAMRPADVLKVFAMATALQTGLDDLRQSPRGRGLNQLLERTGTWSSLPKLKAMRGRGRPKEAETTSAYAMAARERVFSEHASDKGAARVLAAMLNRAPAPDSVTREIRLARRSLPAIPEGWNTTLFADRIRRLQRSDLLRPVAGHPKGVRAPSRR
jgi:hypothetical protein